jgi:hypothetical protein
MQLTAHSAVSNGVVGIAGAPAVKAPVPLAAQDQPKNGHGLNLIINSLDRQWALELSAYNKFGSPAQKPRHSPLASETYRRLKYWYFQKEEPIFDEALAGFARAAPRLFQKDRLAKLCALLPPIKPQSSAQHQRPSCKSIFDKATQYNVHSFEPKQTVSSLSCLELLILMLLPLHFRIMT